ncbi:hypothetical protein WA026_003496 [Henosepilachna vigintioctopunctata]|uniref:Uncharacterized protein n=1 Tax=Henosepilachna vigintioctopunctata TaxID=420089 RepID=A0AAW1TIG6_9CUCU
MAIKLEKNGGSISYPNYPYTFEEDKEAIVGVVSKVEDSLSDAQRFSPGSKPYTVTKYHRGIRGPLEVKTSLTHKMKVVVGCIAFNVSQEEDVINQGYPIETITRVMNHHKRHMR